MWEEARRKQEEEARKIREKEEEARKMLERLEQARKARKQEEQERKMLEQQKQARRRGRRGTAVPNPVLDPKEMDAEAREARRQRLEKLRAKAGTRRGGG
jgi:colicin import membrane protein